MEKMKSFLDLEFSDAFMFAATMEDEELCRQVLSRILEIPVKKVKVHKESTILINPEYRGIRMDVYADDEQGTVYDIEMQTTRKGNLPRRSSCYQGQMDVPAELISFLRFVENGTIWKDTPEDALLQKLHERISYLKHSRRLEERYMLFGEM